MFLYNGLIEARQKIKYFVDSYYGNGTLMQKLKDNQDSIELDSTNSIPKMSGVILRE